MRVRVFPKYARTRLARGIWLTSHFDTRTTEEGGRRWTVHNCLRRKFHKRTPNVQSSDITFHYSEARQGPTAAVSRAAQLYRHTRTYACMPSATSPCEKFSRSYCCVSLWTSSHDTMETTTCLFALQSFRDSSQLNILDWERTGLFSNADNVDVGVSVCLCVSVSGCRSPQPTLSPPRPQLLWFAPPSLSLSHFELTSYPWFSSNKFHAHWANWLRESKFAMLKLKLWEECI